MRAAALGAVERLGAVRPDDIASALVDPDPAVRRRGAVVAARHGGEVAHAVLALLDDGDASVVEAACFALGECEAPVTGAVERLSRVARSHADPLCRESAVAALGAIGEPAGLAAILACCEDRATVRRRAVLALAPFDGPEVEAALERAARDRDWQVRQAAEDLL